MTTVRRVIREKAFQSLFQLTTHEELATDEAIKLALESTLSHEDSRTMEEAMADVLPENKNKNKIITDALTYLKILVTGALEHQEEIDQTISKHLKKWSINRLERTNLSLLRLATYELLYQPDVDKRIVMNEAIEMAKTFNDDKSSKFINGVLQSIIDNK
ncbi:MAG: transcription antitermination factor NusB [Alkalibacterium sp.]|uniref:Transcription antitermination protein NusB n=1 Tax=Alkalibacterium gilvum TaxID=1130080 RepID=A0A1H6RA54_9LACT|nr:MULTISPECIES: transcription antitermination factor NusB [Alkalibacterium]MDN6193573.1 transcription antitermination factor NusB [Alkalibacterium sp.]MDN6294010.1 transcription antitermination factor NusB [Alkalibacterium sp.]MDN6295638.1 transcription antitermination factor NusB [Alkalibacterium sp.]MDN6326521.1 transcription antitermination factor NusB [Alkalibacterium sp.]MDN6385411.1 transcription antitermination factor NusB [Alkalibacterium sp.]